MGMDETMTIKDAVHRIQLSLFEGIKHENQLAAAGSLISQTDYQDVVTERTIASLCGFPLCSNSLPAERTWKGNYHISLKEHKVYDLQETYKYCSSGCLINSRAFSGSLQQERSTMSSAKINEVISIFEGLGYAVNMGKSGDLGLSGLKILEKKDAATGEVPLEDWIGPSNAIEGYVPQRDWNSKLQWQNNHEEIKEQLDNMSISATFTSTIITQDEYSIAKTVLPKKSDQIKEGVNEGTTPMQKPSPPLVSSRKIRSKKFNKDKDVAGKNDKRKDATELATSSQNHVRNAANTEKEICLGKESTGTTTLLKSSLKTQDSKKATQSVTWADEKTEDDGQHFINYMEEKDGTRDAMTVHSVNKEVAEDSYRIASAEACARALSQAAEVVASGESDVFNAVSEADVIILPPGHGLDEAKCEGNNDVLDTDSVLQKWPTKQGFSNDDLIGSEDSWYDSPPEGFCLMLSPFSTMFMALFSWVSSSSLAYIYGKDESFHENYLSVNGKEYPRKSLLPDSRSAEIKQTLAGYLARALPVLVAELRLPTPISTLEQGMGYMLDTMSFLDPLPSLRIKQWQVVALLLLDALSVARIPALTSFMMDRRILLPKVLEGSLISAEEYEIMKDLVIPLGRVPQFSTQSGG